MRRVGLSLIALSALLTASEFQYGSGTFNLNGGFTQGASGSISSDIDTYSLVERHSNIAGSKVFYSYDATWMDSQTLKQTQQDYNALAGQANSLLPTSSPFMIPTMDYRVKGLDANLRLGYDVLHKDEDNFLGLGLMVGISIPWVDSSNSSDSSNDNSNFSLESENSSLNLKNLFQDTKTSIMTYKVGPSINLQKSLTENISLYGIGSIAYQTGYIKNDYIDSEYSVDGTYQELNVGLYFTPFTKSYKLGWITLNPRVYATLGYKYSKWDIDDVTVDVYNNSVKLEPLSMKFGMDSSVGYFGVGYSF